MGWDVAIGRKGKPNENVTVFSKSLLEALVQAVDRVDALGWVTPS